MKKIFLAGVIIILLFLGLICSMFGEKKTKLRINDTVWQIELADTEEERVLGLGGRELLGQNEGMLFLFPQKGQHSFWMKDMRFDLDIIWILDEEIVFIEKNIPFSSSQIYRPTKEADKVLELMAGSSDRSGLRVGDRIEIIQ